MKPKINLPPPAEKMGQFGIFIAIGAVALNFIKKIVDPKVNEQGK